MGDLGQCFIEAVDSIAKSNVKASNATLTIECTIEAIEDAGLQMYKVRYRDNSFNVSSSSGTYKVGDVVYVLVPEGDFNKPKIILGLVSTSVGSLTEDNEQSDEYLELSDESLITLSDNALDMNTWLGTKTTEINFNSADFRQSLINYSNSGKTDFVFKLKIKTNIDLLKQTSTGKYGVYLRIPTLEDPGDGSSLYTNEEQTIINKEWQKLRLLNIDSRTLLGNPFRLKVLTSQTAKFSLSEGSSIDPTRLPQLYTEVSGFLKNDSITNCDILIKDASFKPVQYLTDAQKDTTYLSIVSDTGLFFVSNSSLTKTLKPELRIKGRKTALNAEEYQCYLFRNDNSIDAQSEYYLAIGGLGWKCLNDRDAGSNTFITNIFELIVKKDDILSQATYKCIIIDKNNKTYQAKETITNKTSDIVDFELVTDTGLTDYIKDTGYVNFITRVKSQTQINDLSVAFQRIDKDGNILPPEATDIEPTKEKTDYLYKEGNIFIVEKYYSLPVSRINDINVISCTFSTTDATIGIREIIITTGAKPELRLSIQNLDVLYKYDSNGNSPMVADYAYPNNALQYITPLSYELYRPDNTEISEEEKKYCKATLLIPKNSLFKFGTGTPTNDKYYVIKGKELVYEIADVYDALKVDNYVTLSIEFKDVVIYQTVNLKFVKEGEIGTNGAKYTGVIKYDGYAYGDISNSKIKKLQLAYGKDEKNEFTWFYTTEAGGTLQKVGYINLNPQEDNDFDFFPHFSIDIYCNGGIVTSPAITKEIQLEMFDILTTDPALSFIVTNETNSLKITRRVIKNEKGEIISRYFMPIDAESQFSTLVRAKVTIKQTDEQTGTPYQEQIYAYYPVEVAYANAQLVTKVRDEETQQEKEVYKQIPHIADGFNKVIYASDCTNPQYDSANPFRLESTLDFVQNKGDVYTYNLSASKNLNVQGNANGITCKITPVTKFDSGESLNYVKVGLTVVDDSGIKQKYIDDQNKAKDNKAIADNNIKLLEALSDTDPATTEKHTIPKIFSSIQTFVEDMQEIQENSGLVLYWSYYDGACTDLNTILTKAIEIKKICDSGTKELKTAADTLYNNTITKVINRRRAMLQAGKNIPSEGHTGFENITIINENDNFNKSCDNVNDKASKAIKKQLKDKLEDIKELVTDFDATLGKLKTDVANLNNFSKAIKDLVKFKIEFPSTSELPWIDPEDHSKGRKLPSEFQDKASDLLAWNETYQKVVMRLTDPFNGENNSWTPQEEIEKQNEKYPKENPVYSFLGDVEVNIVNKINKILDSNKTAEYYLGICTTAINFYNAESKYFDNLSKQYQPIIDFYTLEQMTVFRPIVLLANTYEMSWLSDLDGNKLYIDDKHGDDAQFLYAPQVGAGTMETTSTGGKALTGMVMGLRGFDKTKQGQEKTNQIGLFGYSMGIQTMFLNARDGSAILGKAGAGQIIIDPSNDNGLIYSSTYWKNYKDDGKPNGYGPSNISGEGMLIDFTNSYIHLQNETYKKDKDGNYVDENGEIISDDSQKVKIKDAGRVYSGTHNEIGSTNPGFFLSKDGLSIGSKVKITEEGIAYFGTNAVGEGKKCLTINGGNPDEDVDSYIGLDASGFGVTFTKDSTNRITGVTVNSSVAKLSSVYIGTNGIRLGQKFAVNSEGDLLSNNAYITGTIYAKLGEIGDLTIEGGKIVGEKSGGQIILDAKGAISAKEINGQNETVLLEINRNGNATFNNIKCQKVFEIGDSGTSNYLSSEKNGEGGYTNSFNFSGGGSSLGSNNAFIGGGSAVYESDLPDPLRGGCVTQINTLVANKIIATDISADRITSGTLNTNKIEVDVGGAKIKGILDASHISADSITSKLNSLAYVQINNGLHIGDIHHTDVGFYYHGYYVTRKLVAGTLVLATSDQPS